MPQVYALRRSRQRQPENFLLPHRWPESRSHRLAELRRACAALSCELRTSRGQRIAQYIKRLTAEHLIDLLSETYKQAAVGPRPDGDIAYWVARDGTLTTSYVGVLGAPGWPWILRFSTQSGQSLPRLKGQALRELQLTADAIRFSHFYWRWELTLASGQLPAAIGWVAERIVADDAGQPTLPCPISLRQRFDQRWYAWSNAAVAARDSARPEARSFPTPHFTKK